MMFFIRLQTFQRPGQFFLQCLRFFELRLQFEINLFQIFLFVEEFRCPLYHLLFQRFIYLPDFVELLANLLFTALQVIGCFFQTCDNGQQGNTH